VLTGGNILHVIIVRRFVILEHGLFDIVKQIFHFKIIVYFVHSLWPQG